MRARRFRPMFDKLDGRIVLDATLVAVAPSASVDLVNDPGTSSSGGLMPGEETTASSGWNWPVSGAPSSPSLPSPNSTDSTNAVVASTSTN